MNSFYADHVLARAISHEKINHRESIQLDRMQNPLVELNAFVSRIVDAVREKLQQPTLVPVYCFEYAPDC